MGEAQFVIELTNTILACLEEDDTKLEEDIK
jgi:hypothetical protein